MSHVWRKEINPSLHNYWNEYYQTWGNWKWLSTVAIIPYLFNLIFTIGSILIFGYTVWQYVSRAVIFIGITALCVYIYVRTKNVADLWRTRREIKFQLIALIVFVSVYICNDITFLSICNDSLDSNTHCQRWYHIIDLALSQCFLFIFALLSTAYPVYIHERTAKMAFINSNSPTAIRERTKKGIAARRSQVRSQKSLSMIATNRLSLADILNHPSGYYIFMIYLVDSFCSESLLFLSELIQIKHSYVTDNRNSICLPYHPPMRQFAFNPQPELSETTSLDKRKKRFRDSIIFSTTGMEGESRVMDDKENSLSHGSTIHRYHVPQPSVAIPPVFKIGALTDANEDKKNHVIEKRLAVNVELSPPVPLDTHDTQHTINTVSMGVTPSMSSPTPASIRPSLITLPSNMLTPIANPLFITPAPSAHLPLPQPTLVSPPHQTTPSNALITVDMSKLKRSQYQNPTPPLHTIQTNHTVAPPPPPPPPPHDDVTSPVSPQEIAESHPPPLSRFLSPIQDEIDSGIHGAALPQFHRNIDPPSPKVHTPSDAWIYLHRSSISQNSKAFDTPTMDVDTPPTNRRVTFQLPTSPTGPPTIRAPTLSDHQSEPLPQLNATHSLSTEDNKIRPYRRESLPNPNRDLGLRNQSDSYEESQYSVDVVAPPPRLGLIRALSDRILSRKLSLNLRNVTWHGTADHLNDILTYEVSNDHQSDAPPPAKLEMKHDSVSGQIISRKELESRRSSEVKTPKINSRILNLAALRTHSIHIDGVIRKAPSKYVLADFNDIMKNSTVDYGLFVLPDQKSFRCVTIPKSIPKSQILSTHKQLQDQMMALFKKYGQFGSKYQINISYKSSLKLTKIFEQLMNNPQLPMEESTFFTVFDPAAHEILKLLEQCVSRFRISDPKYKFLEELIPTRLGRQSSHSRQQSFTDSFYNLSNMSLGTMNRKRSSLVMPQSSRAISPNIQMVRPKASAVLGLDPISHK